MDYAQQNKFTQSACFPSRTPEHFDQISYYASGFLIACWLSIMGSKCSSGITSFNSFRLLVSLFLSAFSNAQHTRYDPGVWD